jgi:hypothetical protein
MLHISHLFCLHNAHLSTLASQTVRCQGVKPLKEIFYRKNQKELSLVGQRKRAVLTLWPEEKKHLNNNLSKSTFIRYR